MPRRLDDSDGLLLGNIELPGNVPERREARLTNADVAAISVALLGPEAAAAGLSTNPRHSVVLQVLSLRYNRLSDTDEVDAAAAVVGVGSSATSSATAASGLAVPEASRHLAALAALACASLHVDLRHNFLGPMAVEALLGPLEADWESKARGPEAPGAAGAAADALEHVQTLAMDGNPLLDAGGLTVAAALPRLKSLRCLGLEGCQLGSKGFTAVCTALQGGCCDGLLELRVGDALLGSCSGSGREQDELYRLARAVRDGCPKLQVLTARRLPTATSYAGATLAEHLEDHPALAVLDLGGCKLAGEGAAALARLSVVNPAIQEFGLRGCRAGDEGAMAWAAAVRGGCGAAVLDLRQNGIGEEGLTELLGAVAEAVAAGKQAPERLLLWGNDWRGAPAARAALQTMVETGAVTARADGGESPVRIDCEPTVVDGEVEVAQSPLDD